MSESTTGSWKYLKDDPSLSDGAAALDSQEEAVHMCVIYNEELNSWKILYFMAAKVPPGPGHSHIESRILDVYAAEDPFSENPKIVLQEIPDWPASSVLPSLFCCGHAFDEEGRFFCAGGRNGVDNDDNGKGLSYTYIYDPHDDSGNGEWKVSRDLLGNETPMAQGRWYPTVTRLGENAGGYTFAVITGTNEEGIYNRDTEAFKPSDGWKKLNDEFHPAAELPVEFEEYGSEGVTYPGGHLIPYSNSETFIKAGEIFYAFPLRQPWRLNVDGLGGSHEDSYWIQFETEYEPNLPRDHSASVMLPLTPAGDKAEVLLIGGGPGNGIMPTEIVQSIDLAGTPEWITKGSLKIPRQHVNAVLMPDGKIFISGGAQKDAKTNGITLPEIYDPNGNGGAGESTIMSVAATFTRMYHSTAILLPDARILCSAGEFPYNNGIENKNFEIYSPPYLFGARPDITTDLHETPIIYSENFVINTDSEIDEAILMSLCAPTHGFDQNQRAVYLTINEIGENEYRLTAPANANIAPEGWYMLFVLKVFSTDPPMKIPSVAKFVKLVHSS